MRHVRALHADHERLRRHDRLRCLLGTVLGPLIVAAGWWLAPVPGFAQERPAQIIAAQIRMQGFQCDNPSQAQHDASQSRPNGQVWVLDCGNATYRITLIPDMAARVERLR